MNALKAMAGRLAVVAALVAPVTFASSAIAAENSEQSWEFEFTPYLFAPGLEGTTGVLGVTADVQVPFEELFDNVDSFFMATFEARRGKWLFLFDAMSFHLSGVGTKSWQGPLGIGSATGQLDLLVRQKIYQSSAGYRVFDGETKLDVIGGARYTDLDTDLNLVTTTGGLLPGGTRSLSTGKNWWDPIIGARITVPFAEHWSAFGYIDVGGFGVGSDFTYQAIAGANWQFAKSFSAKAGYRYFYQDFEDGGFVWDMSMKGPFLGLGIRF